MTSRERFEKVLSFSRDVDRLPVTEWAPWWTLTLDAWEKEGLNVRGDLHDLHEYFGLDRLHQFWFEGRDPNFGEGISKLGHLIENEQDYMFMRPYVCSDGIIEKAKRDIDIYLTKYADKDYAVWMSLDGFFWYPRTLFGIENHLYAFYDHADLMTRMNEDLCEFYIKLLDMVYSYIDPVFMTFAEDMSYNLGPMISKDLYDEFMDPYFKILIPKIKAHGTHPFIDTDGFVEPLIPWFLQSGIEGILPLERMAGVDICRIRENYPKLLMVGAFDKTVMHLGEEAMRKEFERIKPVILSGGYIPGVDHQTPPDVTVENYEIFLKLLREYCGMYGNNG